MDSIRRHQVALKGVVSTVVVTTLVLEGARRAPGAPPRAAPPWRRSSCAWYQQSVGLSFVTLAGAKWL